MVVMTEKALKERIGRDKPSSTSDEQELIPTGSGLRKH
jgi:hypothetical protein